MALKSSLENRDDDLLLDSAFSSNVRRFSAAGGDGRWRRISRLRHESASEKGEESRHHETIPYSTPGSVPIPSGRRLPLDQERGQAVEMLVEIG